MQMVRRDVLTMHAWQQRRRHTWIALRRFSGKWQSASSARQPFCAKPAMQTNKPIPKAARTTDQARHDRLRKANGEWRRRLLRHRACA
jgi:hypothetical protein